MPESFSIAQLAQEFDITTRAVRFYEDKGLLSPKRKGQRRVYAPRDRVRLKLIMRGKRLGFSLNEIKDILSLYDVDPTQATQLRHLLPKIKARRTHLSRQREDITVILRELNDLELKCKECLEELSHDLDQRPGKTTT